jgi:pimeloyl-ACP methyl ester carboxylesterase
MLATGHLINGAEWVAIAFICSVILVSLVGSFIGARGHQVHVSREPSSEFESIVFSSLATDKLRLSGWFLPAKTRKVAVLAHGWGGNRATLLDLAEYLQQKGINVLTFDMRGGTGRNTYGHREAGDIAGAFEWLRINKYYRSEDIVLIGNSLGGAASIDFASSHSIGKLVLISSVINLHHTKSFYASDFHLIFPSIYAASVTITERFLFGIKPTNPINVFEKITAPILVIHGDADPKSPIKDVYTLQQRSTHQKVEYIVVPGGGHKFFVEETSDQNHIHCQKIVDFIFESDSS